MSGAARLIARKEHPESEQQGWSMLRTHDGMAKIHAQRQPVHKTSVVAEAFEVRAEDLKPLPLPHAQQIA